MSMPDPERPAEGLFRRGSRSINGAVLIALIAVSILGTVSYQAVSRLGKGFALVSHTEEVIASIRSVLVSLGQAEAGQRGYVLTGQDSYLESYTSGAQSAPRQMQPLKNLVSDNPPQRRRAMTLDSLVQLRLERLAQAITAYQREGLSAAQSFIQNGIGAALSDQIVDRATEMQETESQLLKERLRRASDVQQEAMLLIVLSVLLAMALLIGAGIRLNNDARRRKQTEAQLRDAVQNANAANEAKTQFLATVSHEIRTPLNAVVGMTDLLLDTKLESEQAEFARTIQANSESLLILISDLLDSSKIEAGQVDLESIPFNPEAIIESVAEILEIRAELKGIDIITSADSSIPRQITGDPNRFRQVLMNLVGNAVKFTESGEIVIAASVIHTDGDGRSPALSVAVTDTGIGIAPEDAEKVFERFVQAERSTVRRFGGTGLGLPISRSLVQLMGGELTVESEPGKGSTFRFHIPISEVAGPESQSVTTEWSLATLKVLLVDTSRSRQRAITQWLEAEGASVDCHDSGKAAIDAVLRANGHSVAIINESLPDYLPGELVRELHSAGSNPALPVVLLASLHSSKPALRDTESIVDRIYKPVRRSRLLRAIRQATGLPAASDSTTGTPAPMVFRPTDVSQPRILLVEDQRDNWVLATRILTGAGYQVELAENGMVAFERAKEYRFDLILMDLEMPIVDGFQATGAIRANEREVESGRVPIVALTAHALEGFRERALSGGMDDYLTKPVKKQQLLDICEKWIDKRPVVVIADDSLENQVLITNYLKDRNYRIITANNGLDAVKIFRHQRVSAILLDMDMPVMSGYDAARAIRRMQGGEAIPIVAITGYEGAAAREKCITAGCSTFLSKPVRRDDLVRVVSEILGAKEEYAATREGEARATGSHPSEAPRAPRVSEHLADETTESREIDANEMSKLRRYAGQHRSDLLFMEARRLQGFGERSNLRELDLAASELAEAAARDDRDAIPLWLERVSEALKVSERLLGVRRSGLLDSQPDEALDRLTRLAAAALHVPSAMITLVDQDRQFFKSAVGAKEPYASQRGTPISHSFCQHVAARADSLVVEDARVNPLVRNNPAITELDVIAYAGMPIVTSEGLALGSFCAIDTKPKHWTQDDLAILRDLAALAVAQLERSATEREPAAPHRPVVSPASEALSDSSDGDGIADLLPAYLEARRADVAAIQSHIDKNDFAALKRLGHQMKGSGAAYGFPEITRLGRAMEEAAVTEDSGALISLHQELSRFVESASSSITPAPSRSEPS